MKKCISTPISWLHLEEIHAGRALPEEETTRHLEECEVCKSCYQLIAEDARSMPALEIPVAASPKRDSRRWWWLTLLLPSLAALLFFYRPSDSVEAVSGVRAKGEALEMEVVQERDGAILLLRDFRVQDRFKIRVFCSEKTVILRLVVFQGNSEFTPLGDYAGPCHNDFFLPGAFSLDGHEEVEICLEEKRDGSFQKDERLCVSLAPKAD